MISPNETTSASDSDSPDPTEFPNSRRVYIKGKVHPDIRVPMREVDLAPTHHTDGRIENNEPIRIYDPSGPWGDPKFQGNVEAGLPALRKDWIQARNDVEEYQGRDVQPLDNGSLGVT